MTVDVALAPVEKEKARAQQISRITLFFWYIVTFGSAGPWSNLDIYASSCEGLGPGCWGVSLCPGLVRASKSSIGYARGIHSRIGRHSLALAPLCSIIRAVDVDPSSLRNPSSTDPIYTKPVTAIQLISQLG